MIKSLLNKGRQYLKLASHRKAWRARNSHNLTIASTFFPIDKVKAGNYSYGDLHIISYGEANEGLEIGCYVSIANNVQFLLGGNHFYRRFTNYPFIAKYEDSKYVETWSKGKIIIEDDVWIGTDAFIMSGIKIGRGAIIGARAVVSGNVPPYSIVAGNPAKVVKYRFEDDVIAKLMQIDFEKLTPSMVLKYREQYQAEHELESILKYIS